MSTLYICVHTLCFCFNLQLKRNYFHVKPLERTQLQTWRSYLEAFGIRERATAEDLDYLYERCLVPCVCIYIILCVSSWFNIVIIMLVAFGFKWG